MLRKAFKIVAAIVFAVAVIFAAIGVGLSFYASWSYHVEMTKRALNVP